MSAAAAAGALKLPLGSPGPSGAAAATPVKGPPQKFGVTDPISTQEPGPNDGVMSKKMMEELEDEFPPETEEGMRVREEVLEELGSLCVEWMTEVGVEEKGMSKEEAVRSLSKLVTLGSYRRPR